MRILFFLILIAALPAFASNSGVTYQGRILKPDGSPLSGATTQFRLQIRTPDSNNCLMYEEAQTLDLRNMNGAFSLTINDGTGSRTDSTGFNLDRIFANRGSFTFDPTTCSAGSSYAPNTSDGRNLVVLFKDETMSTWEPIPAQKINFVPFAFDSKQVSGFAADSLIRVVNGSGDPLTGLAPLSNAQYTELMALVNGTSNAFTKAGQLGGVALPTMTSGEVLGWNGSAWVSQPSVAGPNSVTTAMIQNSAVDSTKIASGAVGTSQIASNVTISTSGTVGAAITTTRDFKIYATAPSSFYVGMLAPALASSYSLTWPMDDGNNGEVLTTNGSGVLSWAPAAAASQWTTQAPGINYMGGNVGIGTTSPSAGLSLFKDTTATSGHVDGINNQLAFNPSSTTSTVVWGQINSVLTNGSANLGGSQVYGTYNHVYAINTNATGLGDAKGSMNQVQLAVAGNINNANGAVGDVINEIGGTINYAKGLIGTVNNNGAGTIGDAVGVFAGVSNSGTIPNAYGVYISGVSGTNKYGLFQADTTNKNYFAGAVGIGTSSPFVRKLEVSQASGVLAPASNISPSSIGITNTNTTDNSFSELGFNTNDLGGTQTTGVKLASVFTSHATNAVSADLQFLSRNAGALAEKMRITSGGAVGIGTTSPAQSLDVVGSGALFGSPRTTNSSKSFEFLVPHYNSGTPVAVFGVSNKSTVNELTIGGPSNSAGSINSATRISFITATNFATPITMQERMAILSNGNVGVGVGVPTAALNLKAGTATAGTAPLKFTTGTLLTTPEDGAMEYDSAGGLYFTIGSTRYLIPTNSAAGNFSGVTNINNAAGSITMTPMAGNSVIVNQSTTSTNSSSGALIVNGGVGIAGAVNTGGNIVSGGSITATTNAVIPQIYGSTAASGDIRIDGTPDASKGNVYLASAGGKVGIGTTSPTSNLTVFKSGSGYPLSVSGNTGAGPGNFVNLAINNTTTGAYKGAVEFQNNGTPKFSFGVDYLGAGANNFSLFDNVAGTHRLMVTPTGNIGVGTTSPAYKLDVVGMIGATSTVNAFNFNAISSGSFAPLVSYMSSAGTDEKYWDFFQQGTSFSLRALNDAYNTSNNAVTFTRTGTTVTKVSFPSGNVGIGTTSPNAKLEVYKSSNAASGNDANILISTTANPSAGSTASFRGVYSLNQWASASASGGASVEGIRGEAGTAFTGNLGVLTGAAGLAYQAQASTVTLAQGVTGYTSSQAAGATITNARGGEFGVTQSAGTIANAYGVYVANVQGTNKWSVYATDAAAPSYFAGNVGIGTTAPSSMLHLSGTAATQMQFTNAATGYQPTDGLSFGLDASSNLSIWNNEAGDIYMATNGQERLRIRGGGTMGVGDTNPDFKLEVVDNFAVSATANGDGDRFIVTSGGSVGIGTTSPVATLDLNGFMRLKQNSSAPVACAAGVSGSIAMTSTSSVCVCNGTSWVVMNTATACTW